MIYEGFGKYFNLYMSVFRGFAIIYLKKTPVRHLSKVVKSTLSFLGDIPQVQTGPLKIPVDFFYLDVCKRRNVKTSCTYFLRHSDFKLLVILLA